MWYRGTCTIRWVGSTRLVLANVLLATIAATSPRVPPIKFRTKIPLSCRDPSISIRSATLLPGVPRAGSPRAGSAVPWYDSSWPIQFTRVVIGLPSPRISRAMWGWGVMTVVAIIIYDMIMIIVNSSHRNTHIVLRSVMMYQCIRAHNSYREFLVASTEVP